MIKPERENRTMEEKIAEYGFDSFFSDMCLFVGDL
jgi:hypothetical protein